MRFPLTALLPLLLAGCAAFPWQWRQTKAPEMPTSDFRLACARLWGSATSRRQVQAAQLLREAGIPPAPGAADPGPRYRTVSGALVSECPDDEACFEERDPSLPASTTPLQQAIAFCSFYLQGY